MVKENLMSNKLGRFKGLIILPNTGTAIFEHNYRLETPQENSFKHLLDVKPLTQAIHRAIKDVGSGRLNGNVVLGFVAKWSVQVIISGILN